MDELYNFHQHDYFSIISLGESKVYVTALLSSGKVLPSEDFSCSEEACIVYNKQKTEVLSWGDPYFEQDNEEHVRITNFKHGLFDVFKKGKSNWNQDDKFFLKAVSDYIPLAIDTQLKNDRIKSPITSQNTSQLHHVFIFPSEWTLEINEEVIRPLYIQANLISKDDRKERLTFYSDIECIFYKLEDLEYDRYFSKRGRNTVLSRVIPIEHDTAMIKMDLVSVVKSRYDCRDSLMLPEVLRSRSVYITSSDVKNSLIFFLKSKFLAIDPDGDRGRVIHKIVENIFKTFRYMDTYDESTGTIEHWLSASLLWFLDSIESTVIKSISPSDIYAAISENILGSVKDLLTNNFVKEYKFLTVLDRYSTEADSASKNDENNIAIEQFDIFLGAGHATVETIQNSDMYRKPRRLSTENSVISPSVFIDSKPNSIVSIDISFKSTFLTYSSVNDDGLIEKIYDHSYFTNENHLPSLGNFYKFYNEMTLIVKEQFISFVEKYLIDDLNSLSYDKDVVIEDTIMAEINDILNQDHVNNNKLLRINQYIFIKSFLIIYMAYIKKVISNKLPIYSKRDDSGTNIGYAVTIEKRFINNIIGTEYAFRDIIYSSGLINKNDSRKKLRVIIQGEGYLPMIRNSLNVDFSFKMYFVIAQLYEDYIRITMNQVVTEQSWEKYEQEAIVLQDTIIPIRNINISLCSNMWTNIMKDRHLIRQCAVHDQSDDSAILDLFSLKAEKEFKKNLGRYISKDILSENPNIHGTDMKTIQLSESCSCKVCFTVDDIIDVSFRPILKNFASIISVTFLNSEFFKSYEYLFNVICFNDNPYSHNILAKILKEEIDDFNEERSVDTLCFTIPESPYRLLHPTLAQRPTSYTGFLIGTLRPVYSENCAFYLILEENDHAWYNTKIPETGLVRVATETSFLIFRKGDRIPDTPLNQQFHFDISRYILWASFIKPKKIGNVSKGGMIPLENKTNSFASSSLYPTSKDLSIFISVISSAYSASLGFMIKLVGDESHQSYIVEAEPMTLSRF